MNLKELKKMIAEEYNAYKMEQDEMLPGMEPSMDMDLDDPAISVSDKDVDATGKDSPTDILKDIFDMLKKHFEGDDKPKDDKPKDDKPKDDKPKGDKPKDDKDADVKEASSTNGAYTKSVKESIKRRNIQLKTKKANKLIAEAKMKSRFKTLANIKK